MSVEPTPNPVPAEAGARPGVRERLAGLSTTVKALGGLAGAIASVLALLFLLLPNLQPSRTPSAGTADLSEPKVESPVSFGQYLDRVEISRGSYGEEQLRRPGALVSVEVAIKGYRGQAVPMRWYLLNGTGDIADQQSRRHSLVADRDETPAVWPFWVALPPEPGPFRIVVEVFPPNAASGRTGIVALDKEESAPFAGVGG